MTHTTSLAAWGPPDAVPAGSHVEVHVGATCHTGCSPAGRTVTVSDRAGAPVATGTLGDEPWPGTAGLRWCVLTVATPTAAGGHAWTVRLDAEGDDAAAEIGFSVATLAEPRHQVVVEVIDTGRAKPIAKAHVRLGPYRAMTGSDGRATVAVAPGTFVVTAWKQKYAVMEQPLTVDADTELRLTTEIVPDKDPQYVRDFWV